MVHISIAGKIKIQIKPHVTNYSLPVDLSPWIDGLPSPCFIYCSPMIIQVIVAKTLVASNGLCPTSGIMVISSEHPWTCTNWRRASTRQWTSSWPPTASYKYACSSGIYTYIWLSCAMRSIHVNICCITFLWFVTAWANHKYWNDWNISLSSSANSWGSKETKHMSQSTEACLP